MEMVEMEDEDIDAYLDGLEAECAPAQACRTPASSSTYRQEVSRACFHVVKSVLETQVLTMALPHPQMTPAEVVSIWEQEWGVLHASRIKFRVDGRTLSCHQELPLTQPVVLECRGSVLTALEVACRKRRCEVQSLRQGEEFSWPAWNPQQVLEEHHRKISEEQMQEWRGEGAQRRERAPRPEGPVGRAPLIDPYAPVGAYPSYPDLPSPEPERERPARPSQAEAWPSRPAMPPPVPVTPAAAVPPRPAAPPSSLPFARPSQPVQPAQPTQPPRQATVPAQGPPAKPAKPAAKPGAETWSEKQQRIKREEREARQAENLRRRAARGGPERPEERRPEEDGRLHSSVDLKDAPAPNLSQDPSSKSNSGTSKGGAVPRADPEPEKPEAKKQFREEDFEGVPLRVLRTKQPNGSGLLAWGK